MDGKQSDDEKLFSDAVKVNVVENLEKTQE